MGGLLLFVYMFNREIIKSVLASEQIAIHQYFHEHGFYYFHTPLITASDCEGAGQMFQVTTKNLYDLKKDENGSIVYDDDFFGKMTSLTVSGQLEGELGATALGQIYTFGPTFRAENSNTPRHLAEFWMIEPEVCFYDMDDLMALEEDFIKHCVCWALDNCREELEFLNKLIDPTLIERLEGVLQDCRVLNHSHNLLARVCLIKRRTLAIYYI